MSNISSFYPHLPLLNEIEEIVLAKTIEIGVLASLELKKGDVSSERTNFLISEIKKADQAKNHMVLANSGLVICIAKMFLNRGIDLEDLIQEGNIGLIKAVEKFNYHHGFRFSTYAKWWIRESISRSISNQSRMIRLPVHIEIQLVSLFRVKQTLTQTLGRLPNVGELVEATNLPEKKVTQLLSLSNSCYSLDSISECKEFDVYDIFIEKDYPPSPTLAVSEYFQKRYVESILASLPEIQSLILKYKFGMMDGSFHTNVEISNILHLTSWMVKHYLDIAFSKLRKITSYEEVNDYFLD